MGCCRLRKSPPIAPRQKAPDTIEEEISSSSNASKDTVLICKSADVDSEDQAHFLCPFTSQLHPFCR